MDQDLTTNPLIMKLRVGAALSPADAAGIEAAVSGHAVIQSGGDLIAEGERPDRVHLVLSGLACRYKVLADGSRQILAWLIPGDICDLHVAILGRMDHGIGALSDCRIAYIARADVEALISANPAVNHALWWNTLVDEAILREWLVGMGRRSALAQLAHLFSELLVRFRLVGLAADNAYPLPLTQATLADTLGISTVHVGRVLRQLRNRGAIRFSKGRLHVLDEAGLHAVSGFSPEYLHLAKRERNGHASEAVTSHDS